MCPTPKCTVELDKVLLRAEQKLVDTMLVTDLIHYSMHQKETIVVVTSDDDVWPGIHSAIVHGANIHHVQTIPGRVTPTYYSKLVSGTYHQYTM